jgi:sulfur carrier protein
MLVTVNGERRELPTGATVQSIVQLFSASPQGRGVAVAVGGQVVPRADWPDTEVTDGDLVEVLTAVQGG